MANTATPSLDWPLREDALTGDETLLKQNPEADSTPDPKEEIVPISLILDYVLENLPPGSVQISGGTVSGSNLLLHRTNGVDITIDVSDLLDNKNVQSGSLVSSNNTLRLVLSDSSTVDINVSALNVDTNIYTTGGTLSGNSITFTRNNGSTYVVDVSGLGGGGSDYTLTGFTVGTSTIRMSLKGSASAAISTGHITITVASGGDIKDLCFFIENADMGYTDGTFCPSAGLRITVNNAANSTTRTISRPVRLWKKLFSGAISTANPAQGQSVGDINEVVYSNTSGIFSVAWNDLATNMPQGCEIAM